MLVCVKERKEMKKDRPAANLKSGDIVFVVAPDSTKPAKHKHWTNGVFLRYHTATVCEVLWPDNTVCVHNYNYLRKLG